MTAAIGTLAYQRQIDYFSLSAKSAGFSPISDSLTGYGNVTDTVELSSMSLARYSDQWVSNQLFGAATDTINGRYKTLDTIKGELTESLAGFYDLAGSMFSMAGVNLKNPVTLQADGIGHLVNVSGERSDTEKIDRTLKDNPVLTPRFMIAAALASITHAAQTSSAFVQDYNTDPAATMVKYEETLKQYMLGFQMKLSSSGVSYDFADPIYAQKTAETATATE